MSLSDELSKLGELRAAGTLTDEEFARAKARLLDSPAPGKPDESIHAVNAFRRSRSDRLLGGVCGGIARSSGMDSWVWRLIFAGLLIFAGAGLLVYLLLWLFVPSE